MTETSNPILFIEELRRLPLRRRRLPLPGATLVFRSRSGRLTAPAGGYTAGELWWRGPRVAYEIDTAVHRFTVSWEHERELSEGHVSIEIGGAWRVINPCAVVAHRVTDVPRLCLLRLRQGLAGPLRDVTTMPVLEAAVWRFTPRRVDLVEGVSMGDLQPRVIRAATDQEVVRHLLADHVDVGLREAWLRDQSLAEAGLRALTEEDETPDDEREATIIAALRRLADLNSRLGEHVPQKEADTDRLDGWTG